jgi:UDP-N-acetylmuramoylalanine-D-glutamate ligase
MSVAEIPLRGRHNVANVLAATAVAARCGIAMTEIAAGVEGFEAVPHRLEFVATIDGVDYYNDSIATTPERTLAGMRSFDQPLVFLLGGRGKHLPLEELSREVSRRCRAAVFFGEAREVEAARCPRRHRPRRPLFQSVDTRLRRSWPRAPPPNRATLYCCRPHARASMLTRTSNSEASIFDGS